MKTTGKVFGWIGFSIAFVYIVVLILVNGFLGFNFHSMGMPNMTAGIFVFIGLLFFITPGLWIATLLVKTRETKRVLYILFAIACSFMSILGMVGGILLVITTSKEINVQKFKQINKIYPWEVEGRLAVYPKYVFESFGYITDGFGKYQKLEEPNKEITNDTNVF